MSISIPWKDIVNRAGWTFLQSAAGVLTTGGIAISLSTFDWRAASGGVAVATGMSLAKGLLGAIGQPQLETIVDQLIEEAVAAIEAAHHNAAPVPPPAPLPPLPVPVAPPVASGLPSTRWARTPQLVPPTPPPLDPAELSARRGR